MSGGYYNYVYNSIHNHAEEIEQDFINDGVYKIKNDSIFDSKVEFGDRLENCSDITKPLVLNEIKQLIVDLKSCAKRCKELEWFLEGDISANDFLNNIK